MDMTPQVDAPYVMANAKVHEGCLSIFGTSQLLLLITFKMLSNIEHHLNNHA